MSLLRKAVWEWPTKLHASPSANRQTKYIVLSLLEQVSAERNTAGAGLKTCCMSSVVRTSLLFARDIGSKSSYISPSSSTWLKQTTLCQQVNILFFFLKSFVQLMWRIYSELPWFFWLTFSQSWFEADAHSIPATSLQIQKNLAKAG